MTIEKPIVSEVDWLCKCGTGDKIYKLAPHKRTISEDGFWNLECEKCGQHKFHLRWKKKVGEKDPRSRLERMETARAAWPTIFKT